ncbi:extensin family protein [Pseudoruegeria sp. M32A2M]|nr:extensin family protein [Pseudoruegeria sp. M32A2M]
MVTRIHFNADMRPTERPVHPLAGYSVIQASASAASRAETTYPKVRPAGFGKLFRNRAGGYSRKGAICGVNSIKGTVKASFGNPGSGCGISNPVRVTSIAGVKLSQPATIDCETAKALNNWVENGIKPAIGRKGGGVKELKVAAHYVCRNRNNRSGGRLSEHAKGHAVDISAIRLNNGTELTVAKDWRSRKWSKAMRQIHRAACGPFGTVLGPNADRYHQDHFHVDTARYRSGSYCR